MSKVEDIIQSINELRARRDILRAELNSIEVVGVSALDYASGGRRGTAVSRPTEREATQIADRKTAIEREIVIIDARITMIERAIEALTKIERAIIERKVIDGEPYYSLCGDLHLSESHAKYLKRRALSKVSRVICTQERIYEVG